MGESVKLFKALGDETRIKILILLSKRNMCAKGIARHLNISEAAVSQHIKLLKEVNLIVGYKRGYHVVYDLNKDVINEAIGFLSMFLEEDIRSLDKKFNLGKEDVELLQCNTFCKAMKNCCKRKFKEE